MGKAFSGLSVHWTYDYKILVKTGDKKNAGTDANVKIRLHDTEGQSTGHYTLDVKFRDDFERGNVDDFRFEEKTLLLGPLTKIELIRDTSGTNADWYVEKVDVEDKRLRKVFVFPVHRWIEENVPLSVTLYDAVLPQDDPHKDQRSEELEKKRTVYEYHVHMEGLPTQVKKVPSDELFSDDAKRDLVNMRSAVLKELILIKILTTTDNNHTFSSLEKLYGRLQLVERPMAIDHWKDDTWFGAQRLRGCNAVMIRRCTAIPDNFGVTDEMVAPFLEGMTIQSAIEAKKLYICDYKILNCVEAKEGYNIVRPLGLFFVNKSKDLVPIAIQLFQEKGEGNPVFLPSDDPNLWILVKMWFNVADSSVHQSLTHLGYTHLVMEAIAVCTHRNLSPSHPIFKLLAPHFLFLMAINRRARSVLVNVGGLLDNFMAIGGPGAIKLVIEGYKDWKLNVDGNPNNDFKERGVDDVEALPNYHYRDDCIPVWNALNTYVKKIVDLYYESDNKLKGDNELQQWAKELSAQPPEGIHLKGVPGEGKFDDKPTLVEALTCIIFRGSVSHAAANFGQYDEYSFQPNYPMHLRGEPPKCKDTVKERQMVDALASKNMLIQMIAVSKTLSYKGTESLGLFDTTFLYHPRAVEAAEELRVDLVLLARSTREKNKKRKYPYTVLDPENVPNSISI